MPVGKACVRGGPSAGSVADPFGQWGDWSCRQMRTVLVRRWCDLHRGGVFGSVGTPCRRRAGCVRPSGAQNCVGILVGGLCGCSALVLHGDEASFSTTTVREQGTSSPHEDRDGGPRSVPEIRGLWNLALHAEPAADPILPDVVLQTKDQGIGDHGAPTDQQNVIGREHVIEDHHSGFEIVDIDLLR